MRSVFAIGALAVLTLCLQWYATGGDAELYLYADEPAHYVTGLMFTDYIRQGFPDSPIRFVEQFYVHYPKVAIGSGPPVFYGVQGELDALRKAEVTAVKVFITRQTESFRRPYGHYIEDNPRQCVFAGSTNRTDYLKDETGNRRFWPVKCTRADAERITADREQLWAEAVALFKDGAKWWPERAELVEEITAQQAERMESDPWQPAIELYAAGLDRVKAEAILIHLGFEDVARVTQADRNRVGRCLKALGFEPSQWRNDAGDNTRGYRRTL